MTKRTFWEKMGFYNFTWKNKLKWIIATILFFIPNTLIFFSFEIIKKLADLYEVYIADKILAWIKK